MSLRRLSRRSGGGRRAENIAAAEGNRPNASTFRAAKDTQKLIIIFARGARASSACFCPRRRLADAIKNPSITALHGRGDGGMTSPDDFARPRRGRSPTYRNAEHSAPGILFRCSFNCASECRREQRSSECTAARISPSLPSRTIYSPSLRRYRAFGEKSR